MINITLTILIHHMTDNIEILTILITASARLRSANRMIDDIVEKLTILITVSARFDEISKK